MRPDPSLIGILKSVEEMTRERRLTDLHPFLRNCLPWVPKHHQPGFAPLGGRPMMTERECAADSRPELFGCQLCCQFQIRVDFSSETAH